MATTNSGHHHHHHHHPPHFLYQESVLANRRINNSNTDQDSDDFEMIKFDMWSDKDDDDDHGTINQEKPVSKTMLTSRKLPLKPHRSHQRTRPVTGKSLPVNIPERSKIYKRSDSGDRVDIDDEDEDEDDDEWLPPHEYLARIRSASLSVHEGIGRTLKGRDLSRLRNAIWEQTGFGQD